jgi:hypothetical protein
VPDIYNCSQQLQLCSSINHCLFSVPFAAFN